MYKAIGHCRVSKGDAEEIKNSLASQQTEILKLAIRLGLKEPRKLSRRAARRAI